jgi:CDP-paratose 2-epimerase
MMNFIESPKNGEVYNLGGGRGNSCSILEAFSKIENITGKKMKYEYMEKNREGDHICYISDLSKIHQHFPNWKITKPLDLILSEIADSWKKRIKIDCN